MEMWLLQPDCSWHWNMKVHIKRKHNGEGVPLLLDTQTFHETEGYALRSSDSMESPLNYNTGVGPQAHFAASDPLGTIYANLLKIKKQKLMLQRIESLATEIFNPVTYPSYSLAYPTFTPQSTSPPSQSLSDSIIFVQLGYKRQNTSILRFKSRSAQRHDNWVQRLCM